MQFFYTKGVKPLITPNVIRGKKKTIFTTPTELNIAPLIDKSIISRYNMLLFLAFNMQMKVY